MDVAVTQHDRSAGAVTMPESGAARTFDGIICFGGEDWWYHNRGHFDMQMMREFAAHLPVLYVNSIGMRTPAVSEGRMFARRITRKLRSMTRGLCRDADQFAVCSPFVAPTGPAHALTMPLLPIQVRRAAARLGIAQPLLWIACPTAVGVLDRLSNAGLVYQRTDRFEQFHGVDAERIRRFDAYAKARADLTIFCSPTLMAQEAEQCRRACLIGHGVDLDRFARAGDGHVDEPHDMRDLPRPRVGFVGGIDAHTFDPNLFNAVAKQLPDLHFVLVGGCSLPSGWCNLGNVTMLGRKPFEQVHAYMAGCDVLIMPWARNPWIEACNPVKLKEYLAVGRPIVSTPFGALERYRDAVHIADDADAFTDAIRTALRDPGHAASRRVFVIGETWPSKAAAVSRRLSGAGIEPERDGAALTLPVDCPPTTPTIVEVKLHPTVARSVDAHSAQQPPVVALRRSPRPLRIAECLLLAGGMRPSPLVVAAGRPVLDLWLSPDRTVLDCWIDRLGALQTSDGQPLPIRVISSPMQPALWPRRVDGIDVRYELEPRAYRGTAGVLRDLCPPGDPDDHLLVVEASRYAAVELDALWQQHARHGADLSIACNADGSLAGLYLVRRACLSDVPEIGFTDFKEQFLSRAAAVGRQVRTVALPCPGVVPLWSRAQFLTAAALASNMDSSHAHAKIVTSDESYMRSIVCAGAEVAPSATVVDSVLMPGAVVEAGACVIRSILCWGCRIQEGTDIADAIAGPGGCLSDHDDVVAPRSRRRGHRSRHRSFMAAASTGRA